MNIKKHLYILIGFLPWILFGVLPSYSLASLNFAIIVALVASVLMSYKELKKKFILSWATLIFFLFAFLAVVVFRNLWAIRHMGILANGMLELIGWGSIFVGKPFTEQYAKEKAPKAIWGTSMFKYKNRLLTGIWALLFLINFLISIFLPNAGYVFTLLNLFFTMIIGFGITLFIIEKVKLEGID